MTQMIVKERAPEETRVEAGEQDEPGLILG